MYDFAIIGSGVSGGRLAFDLSSGGANCVLLEAGKEFNAETFPPSELDYSTQLYWGGGLEVTTDGRLGLLRARCVGGTSIVNQALLSRFDDIAWNDWKSRSGVGFFNAKDMEAHYKASEQALSIKRIPKEHYNKNAHTFIRACNKLGLDWEELERAEANCAHEKGSDCIVCLGGCPRDSKQSSLVTTVKRAREKGVKLETEFEVHHLEYSREVVTVVGLQSGAPKRIEAKQVVLAGGTIGNTAILLRSGMKEKLPALGGGFSCHPQYMTYALFSEPIDAHKGAFQAVCSHDSKLRKWGFKLENVFAPPGATAMLMQGFGREHHRLMKKYRHYASMEVCSRDEPMGTIRVDSSDRVRVDKPLTSQDKERVEKGLTVVRELFAAAGAKEIVTCRQGFGLHLMGGCAMGTDPARSVVGPDFRVHGHPNLIAADSSIFSEAPGINPSLTIMALSHRAGQEALKS